MNIKKVVSGNNVLLFTPLLLLYILIVFIFSATELVADENRHIDYAVNLTKGFYTDSSNPSVRNGPGYPMLLAPFKALDISLIFAKLTNAILLFSAVLFFFKTISIYSKPNFAIFISYLFGLYPANLKWLTYLHSESLAIFLSCGFLYFFILLNTVQFKKNKHLLLSATFLGLLALTKVIFGYVILAAVFFYGIAFLFKKTIKLKNTMLLLIVSFSFCVPYLFYTYSVTGKIFYWGTQSGEILYWRSTPFANEYGDWISYDVALGKSNKNYFETSHIIKNHSSFIKGLEDLPHLEKDEKFKAKAIENINMYPLKYIQNTVNSSLRLFFNYPYSYTHQKPSSYFYIIPNMFLIVFLVVSSSLLIWYKKPVPFEIRLVGFISLIFIGGLTLSDGRVRHLLPAIPLLIFLIVFATSRFSLSVNGKTNQIVFK